LSGSEGEKSHVLPHIQIIDLKQMQQCYGMLITLSGDHAREGYGKEGNQKIQCV
jgi:hypothetical protein